MNEVRHIHLIGNPRSGMTITTEAISKVYPSVVYGPFRKKRIDHYNEFIENQNSRLVIKSHIYDLDFFDNYIKTKGINPNSFFNILIIRKNIIESILSHYIARKSGQWGWDDYNKIIKITVDKSELLEICDMHVNELEKILSKKYKTNINKIFLNDDIITGIWKINNYLVRNKLINKNISLSDLNTKKGFDKKDVLNNYSQSMKWCFEYFNKNNFKRLEIKNGMITSYKNEK